MSGILDIVYAEYNYWIYVTLMMIGFYAMIAKKNLIKKVIGANIFQTAIFLFYLLCLACRHHWRNRADSRGRARRRARRTCG